MNDIHHYLLNYINNVDDLNKYCSQNKYFLNLCQENTNIIAKHFLDLYKVDKDPTNFMFIITQILTIIKLMIIIN